MSVTFYDWLYSIYPADAVINGQWGPLHIAVIAICLVLTVLIAVLGAKSPRTRFPIIVTVASLILLFELTRRGINLSRGNCHTIRDYLYTLLPRPWCAISCWMMIFAPIIRKRFWYNACAMNALLCAIVFFVYPVVGFNHKYILFENLYSITTHALLLVSSLSLITLRFTDFSYRRKGNVLGAFAEWLCLGGIVAYCICEMYLLHLDPDPLYILPGNDVQDVVGLSHTLYLIVYVIFLLFYFNVFYIVQHTVTQRAKR